MTNRTKEHLRNLAITALVSLVITIVTIVLLGKTIRYWDVIASMQYIEEQADYTGWTDVKTADYENLIQKRAELASSDSYMKWLLESSHSQNGVIIKEFTITLICAALPSSLYMIYFCISRSYKIMENEKKQISQRDSYQNMHRKNQR